MSLFMFLTKCTHQLRLVIIVLISLFLHQFAFGQTVLRVDGDDGLAVGDGLTWPTAYKYLQDALAFADMNPGSEEIWVAEWTYHPDQNAANPNGTGDRNASFPLLNNVEIYGGFEGNDRSEGGETMLSQREPLNFTTILSGVISSPPFNNPPLACTDPDVNAGNCLEETPGIPGCTNADCCGTVCEIEPLCCTSEWDVFCVDLAKAFCGLNAYHVVTGYHPEPSTRLDGFTITDGRADGSSPDTTGWG